MKSVILFIGLAVGITATIIIGTRLNTDALGVIVGAACGASVAIPTSLVLVWALVRRTGGGQQSQQVQPQYPPVIVIGGNGQPMSLPGTTPPPWESLPAPRREFKVVPDDEWGDG